MIITMNILSKILRKLVGYKYGESIRMIKTVRIILIRKIILISIIILIRKIISKDIN